MKMKRCVISFEKVIKVVAYFPEGTSVETIEKIVENVANGSIREWDHPDWEASCSFIQTIEVDEEKLRQNSPANKYGYRPLPEFFNDPDAVVADDDVEDLVTPSDATWWKIPNNDTET